jgi:Zn-dependent peptidase ImmA (M78 family)/transcriptional regulator with XRE-family HTH domain
MNAELFRWARETAGLDANAAAKALGIKPAKLEAIEQGEHEPSRPQLLNMVKVYRRPLITFYLPKPPERGERGEDFRTLPPDRTQADDALLDALIRDVRSRQSVVRTVAEEEEDESKPLRFIGSCTMKDSSKAVLASIKEVLRIDLTEYRSQKNAEEAFGYLRAQAERAGIYVLLMGNLGTHHSAIAVETFRGFAIADPIAPFVVINDQDARTAWSFTLLHEIAHLWLGTTGVSGTSFEKAIERFCNDVASNFLLPAAELRELNIGVDTTPARAIELITVFANKRFVSRKMVAYGLLKANRIDLTTWRAFDAALSKLWQKEKATDKQKGRESESDSGPNYYVVRRHRLGRALLGFVERSMGAGALTPVKAAKVLGVKPRSVFPLLAARAAGRPGRDGARG